MLLGVAWWFLGASQRAVARQRSLSCLLKLLPSGIRGLNAKRTMAAVGSADESAPLASQESLPSFAETAPFDFSTGPESLSHFKAAVTAQRRLSTRSAASTTGSEASVCLCPVCGDPIAGKKKFCYARNRAYENLDRQSKKCPEERAASFA